MTDVLLLACLFLFAGTIAVPVASKLKLGSVLGYIIAGILISPLLTSLKVDVVTLQHFAEFGVVMMLFLVGLELEPKRLWEMRSKLLGLGGLQVLITAGLVAAGAQFFGLPLGTSIAIGFVFSLSSTAIVLQTLNERGLMKSEGGQNSFSVLLFQDIAVIAMLAMIPLLAPKDPVAYAELIQPAVEAGIQLVGGSPQSEGGHHSLSLVKGLSSWQQALVTFVAIALIIFGGIRLSRPFFRFAASARLREILVAAALLWVVAIALVMSLVELSPALGTFLAGVVLANSEYKHELEGNIDPFKGLLLGLFFMTVGASINFTLLFDNLGMVLGLAFGVIALKASVLYGLARMFKMHGSDKWLFALGLAQAGEFAFVLIAFIVANNVMPSSLSDLLLLVVALTMLLTPALFIIQQRFFSKGPAAKERPADEVKEKEPIIIAGHGRFGGVVNRMLRGFGYETTVLDFNYDQLEMLRKFDFEVYFGDATRPELLHAAGIEEAKVLIIAIDDQNTITQLTKYCTDNFPNLHVISRAVNRHHVYELYAAGCRDIIRETFDSSLRCGRSALEALGHHPFDAERKTKQFELMDKRALRTLAPLFDPDIPAQENPEYVKKILEVRKEQEALLQGKDRVYGKHIDRGWFPPTMKDVRAEEAEHHS